MNKIKFGTDGWRGIIAEDFTYDNVKLVAQAIADLLGTGKKVVLGYDTRFMSKEYARLIERVLNGNGIKTIFSESPAPTPMLSYYVKHKKLNGGVIVTASHNPSIYNGIKFKEPEGCSSLPATTNKIEALIGNTPPKLAAESIQKENICAPYISAIRKYMIAKHIKGRHIKVVVDSMYGAGGFYLEEILKQFGHKVITIHGDPNPLFPGMNPEPIGHNLAELSQKVLETKSDLGIATDGDADRVGIVDNQGSVLTPHYVLALLFIHLVTSRGWGGALVKTISSSSLLNRIAEKHNIKVIETPVGFKHIADLMLKGNILIGGEESGGNGFKNHIPERDGLLSGLLLVEMIGARKKKLIKIVKDMENEYGAYKYKRVDLNITRERINNLFNNLHSNTPSIIEGNRVAEIKKYDGTKFIFDDGSWLLLRASGTEPILRIYSEARTLRTVSNLIYAAKKMI